MATWPHVLWNVLHPLLTSIQLNPYMTNAWKKRQYLGKTKKWKYTAEAGVLELDFVTVFSWTWSKIIFDFQTLIWPSTIVFSSLNICNHKWTVIYSTNAVFRLKSSKIHSRAHWLCKLVEAFLARVLITWSSQSVSFAAFDSILYSNLVLTWSWHYQEWEAF